jgi:hypothetical protein
MPGGIDVFGCNLAVRDQLAPRVVRTSLVGQLIWLGSEARRFRTRLARQHGKSAWSWRKKVDYFLDSVFAFTDGPIKALLVTGGLGLLFSTVTGLAVLVAKMTASMDVPGYTATVLTILFFSALNLFGLGVVGSYAYRAFENSRGRPAAIVMTHSRFTGRSEA